MSMRFQGFDCKYRNYFEALCVLVTVLHFLNVYMTYTVFECTVLKKEIKNKKERKKERKNEPKAFTGFFHIVQKY